VGERSQRVVEERAVFRNEVVELRAWERSSRVGRHSSTSMRIREWGGGPAELVLGEVAGDRLKQ
jgi:hypothetical protein